MDLKVYEKSEAFVWKDNDLEFHCTKLVLKDGNSQYFYTTTRDRLVPNYKVDMSKLELVPIPTDDIWPPFAPCITQAPDPLPDCHYVKEPSLLHYGDTEASLHISTQILNEIAACEVLKKHPHSNVATYLGCVVKDGRVRGLCFVKYARTLAQRMKMPTPFDVSGCQQGIRAGLRHMHEHGLIHNDLNPTNIMVDDADNPIIIDFDSCKREGEELGIKAGTFGWAVAGSNYAIRKNDLDALGKIDAFLMEASSGMEYRNE